LPQPHGVAFVAVRSTEQMAAAVIEKAASAHVIVMSAAVSDYRPAATALEKMKKADGPFQLEMVRTQDILKTLGGAKGDRFLVGFAAETSDVVGYARGKLRAKNLDLIVANDVGRDDRGFGADRNAAWLIDAAGGERETPLVSKRELAEMIWDRVVALRKAAVPAALPTTA
jgi:phosphopantothenoylcysteine decarboxylase/phosphopantothenate--cysteine ligase